MCFLTVRTATCLADISTLLTGCCSSNTWSSSIMCSWPSTSTALCNQPSSEWDTERIKEPNLHTFPSASFQNRSLCFRLIFYLTGGTVILIHFNYALKIKMQKQCKGYVYKINIILSLSSRIQEHVFLLFRTGDTVVRHFFMYMHKKHLVVRHLGAWC